MHSVGLSISFFLPSRPTARNGKSFWPQRRLIFHSRLLREASRHGEPESAVWLPSTGRAAFFGQSINERRASQSSLILAVPVGQCFHLEHVTAVPVRRPVKMLAQSYCIEADVHLLNWRRPELARNRRDKKEPSFPQIQYPDYVLGSALTDEIAPCRAPRHGQMNDLPPGFSSLSLSLRRNVFACVRAYTYVCVS